MTKNKEYEAKIGASEFAAILNGDNPQAMLRILKQFRKIVRRERHLALSKKKRYNGDNDNNDEMDYSSGSDNDDDYDDDSSSSTTSSSNDDDDDGNKVDNKEFHEPPNKKFKKSEAWKKDTASYHVPFVGTAVASGGDIAPVIPGEWPTGLLQSYLIKSPMAAELINDDMIPPDGKIHRGLIRRKRGTLSRALFKAYLLALSELMTAVIPIQNLKKSNKDNNNKSISKNENENENNNTNDHSQEQTIMMIDQPFFSIFLKKYTTMIFKVLNDETEKGKGKVGVFGGCGSWAAPALKLLQTISRTSTTNARLVARYLEEQLSDGVLRTLLRPPPPSQRRRQSNKDDTNNKNNDDDNDNDNDDDDTKTNSKPSRVESIKLATNLLKVGDSAVNSYICTGGSKERKVKPGILYIALREGLAQGGAHSKRASVEEKRQRLDEDHMFAVAEMLQAIRTRLLDQYTASSQRLYGELLSKDAFHNICSYIAFAPPVAAGESFQSVLAGTDKYKDIDDDELAGVEARRLVFLLLSDTSNSPLLQKITKDTQQTRRNVDILELVKSIAGMLDTTSSGGMLVRKFVIHSIQKTPSFLPSFFGILSSPDPRNIFDFISSMNFIVAVQRHGPTPLACFLDSDLSTMEPEEILTSVLPLKLQRNQIGRALQNSNELVVLEALKVVKSSLERFELLQSGLVSQKKTMNWDKDDRLDKLTASFSSKWVPDVQSILSLRSKFDTFSRKKAHVLINDCIFRVIETYSRILPSTIKEAKFDWMKLLPSAKNFAKATPLIQNRIMKTLILATDACEGASVQHSNQIKTVLEILLSTKNKTVYRDCRDIAQNLLLATLQSTADDKKLKVVKHEISCWIDALSMDYMDGFCNTVQEVLNNLLGLLSNVGPEAAEYAFSGDMEFSVILIAALRSENPTIAAYVSQVCARCLLRQRNPIPLATLIESSSSSASGSFTRVSQGKALVAYAKCLLKFNGDNGRDRLKKLKDLLQQCFSNKDSWTMSCILEFDSSPVKAIKTIPIPTTYNDALSFSRFLIHMHLCSESTKSISLAILTRVIPVLILLSAKNEDETSALLEDIRRIETKQYQHEFQVLNQLIVSCPSSNDHEAIEQMQDEDAKLIYDSREECLSDDMKRGKLLRLFMVQDALSAENIIKTKIGLLNLALNEGQQLSGVALRWVLHFATSTSISTNSAIIVKYDPDVLLELVRCWWSLAQKNNDTGAEKGLLVEAASDLSSFLSGMLIKNDINSVAVGICIDQYSASQYMDLSFRLIFNELRENSSVEVGNSLFLKALLEWHPQRYTPVFLDACEKHGNYFKQIWENGVFDDVVLVVLKRHGINPKSKKLKQLFTKILSRACDVLSKIECTKEYFSNIKGLLEVVDTALVHRSILASTESIRACISDGIEKVFKEKYYFESHSSLKILLKIGMQLVDIGYSIHESEKGSQIKLATRLFMLLCELLPKAYKLHAKDSNISIAPELVIDWLLSLLEKVTKYDVNSLNRADTTMIQKLCRSCLKFGVVPMKEDSSLVPKKSIRLVRTIVELSFNSDSAFCDMKSCFIVPPPADVLSMLSSHSKFHLVMSSHSGTSGSDSISDVRIEILRLMHSCVTLGGDDIIFPESLWLDLYTAFSAGIGKVDTLIRLLIQVCCTHKGKGIHVPYLDQFRWGGIQGKEGYGGGRWDWFLNALDPSRIRATVLHFPLYDALRLDLKNFDDTTEAFGLNAAEAITRSDDDDDDDSSASGSSDSDTKSSSASERSADLESVKSHSYPSNHGLSPGVSWNRDSRDNRYSPGFVLPLILGAAESCLLGYHENDKEPDIELPDKNSENASTPEVFTKNLIPTIHRLCDKGALSLCLASLASNCDEIRQYAIAILGVFLLALNSEEARQRASWRDRPQLAMVLNSVQRAYVLKRAGKDKSDPSNPILSPLVSIFLARASVSISKPEDALFSSLNHYFLKTEKDHGAFQDMSRLPGFISLFCSSSEDPLLARKERMWALQTLRDGFLHRSCYRLVSTCHAPELIMTSFENVRLGKLPDEMRGQEVTLLLEVLKKLIDFGGSTAIRHLTKLVGLLSWMCSICISRNIHESFPTISAKCAFCNLLSSACKIASLDQTLRTDDLLHEVGMLAQAVLEMFLIDNSISNGVVDLKLLQACRRALDALSGAFSSFSNDFGKSANLHHSGFSVSAGLQFLTLVPEGQQAEVANALSVLPANFSQSSPEEAKAFCLKLCHASCESETIILDIFKRISMVGKRYKNGMGFDIDLLKALLLMRSNAIQSDETYSQWLRCVDLYSSSSVETSSEGKLARKLVENECNPMDLE